SVPAFQLSTLKFSGLRIQRSAPTQSKIENRKSKIENSNARPQPPPPHCPHPARPPHAPCNPRAARPRARPPAPHRLHHQPPGEGLQLPLLRPLQEDLAISAQRSALSL